ncbi:MAG: ABC transporter permease [Rhodothermaceae bacterium]|nr:MAG: ABC transporter permease [Rhodothermaceae bacterium]
MRPDIGRIWKHNRIGKILLTQRLKSQHIVTPMRTILFILQKEFLQIFRNRAMLPILFVMPIIQLLVLSFAATFEVKNTPVSLIDLDGSPTARRLVARFEASGYFTVVHRTYDPAAADEAMQRGDVRMILQIPAGFERDLRRDGAAPVQLILDAQDGATAGVVQAYANRILGDYTRDLQVTFAATPPDPRVHPVLDVVFSHWYNPELNYHYFMVPGILVLLVTMIGTFLSAMNVVREKELGTIEQLNVTPLRKRDFIVGKLLPFWILALVELSAGLVVARLVFHVPMLGNLALVYALTGVYLVGMLGLGLWISTFTETQQQAMFIAWFLMVVFILMSGLFTPIESMPGWAQKLTLLNPIAYFIEIMRRVLLKGAGFADVQPQFWALVAFAVTSVTLAVRQYRKVSA